MSNKDIYLDDNTVDFYSKLVNLQECEKKIFNKYISKGCRVLDLGVGGGRTTEYLSKISDRYVGVDYSEAMIDVCKNKFPGIEFYVLDAVDLSKFESAQFDVVVFSFNGIDYIEPYDKRLTFYSECYRVLKADGTFIFSSHNARSLIMLPDLKNVSSIIKCSWRILYSIYKSVILSIRVLTKKAFYSGYGYVYDPVHGGLKTYTSTPNNIIKELKDNGFSVNDVVSNKYPNSASTFSSGWYYYSCSKL